MLDKTHPIYVESFLKLGHLYSNLQSHHFVELSHHVSLNHTFIGHFILIDSQKSHDIFTVELINLLNSQHVLRVMHDNHAAHLSHHLCNTTQNLITMIECELVEEPIVIWFILGGSYVRLWVPTSQVLTLLTLLKFVLIL